MLIVNYSTVFTVDLGLVSKCFELERCLKLDHITDLVFIVAFAVVVTILFSCLLYRSYVTEGDNRIPKIYTKTGDKGFYFLKPAKIDFICSTN